MSEIKIYNDDCQNVLKNLEDNSIDLILCDPPFGMMQDFQHENNKNNYLWDEKIPLDFIFNEAYRLLKKSQRLILFCNEPYTSEIMEFAKHKFDWTFCQKLIYLKNFSGNSKVCKVSCPSVTEDILVFKKINDYVDYPDKKYFQRIKKEFKITGGKLFNHFGNLGYQHLFENGKQYNFPSEEKYQKLVDFLDLTKWEGYLSYEEIYKLNRESKPKTTFNIDEFNDYHTNVFSYAKDKEKLHPTQKPVKLMEDLVKLYSKKGETVLDFAAGSGSTGVACQNLDRNFVGVEKEKEYFEIMKTRLQMSD